MAWIVFEITINVFQGLLILLYIKRCFSYSRRTRLADVLLVSSFAGLLSLYLFVDISYSTQSLLFALPLAHTLCLSREPRLSIVYWLLVLILVMNTVSVLTYPLFDTLPLLFGVAFPSLRAERFVCILVTNIMLFFLLNLIVRLKAACFYLRRSSYIVFISTLASLFLINEGLYAAFIRIGAVIPLQILIAYMGLMLCLLLVILLFYLSSLNLAREKRYRDRLSLMHLTKLHQHELSQIHEELVQQRHDYKQHLQTLQELVRTSSSAEAQDYLDEIIKQDEKKRHIVTGCTEVDALLNAKQRLMKEHGITFRYNAYPLASLPIPAYEFCTIIGNLLDNAIEGIARMPEPHDHAIIQLSFSRAWDMFYIFCENPCNPATITLIEGEYVSSKQAENPDIHGIGLHSIRFITDRAQGRAEFAVLDGLFCAKIVLPYIAEGRLY